MDGKDRRPSHAGRCDFLRSATLENEFTAAFYPNRARFVRNGFGSYTDYNEFLGNVDGTTLDGAGEYRILGLDAVLIF